ncbi:MAG TPA: transcription antitermination factor NusB [Chthoniobacteraceae bacterium]|nr:transcription antitermination factor NusB [Chthoniobacteraceae bacterium]
MGVRREGRETAIQFLYHRDLNGEGDAETVEAFWSLRPAPRRVREFGMTLAQGVIGQLEVIDERIRKAASNYELHRIAAVDRNILRLAIYEMLFCPEIPPVVSINEAIEIAKRFGSEDSGRFVNGVLDRIRGDLPRPPRIAGTAS